MKSMKKEANAMIAAVNRCKYTIHTLGYMKNYDTMLRANVIARIMAGVWCHKHTHTRMRCTHSHRYIQTHLAERKHLPVCTQAS